MCACVCACVRVCVCVPACVCICCSFLMLYLDCFSVRQAIGSLAGNSMHVRALAAGFCAIFEAAKR